MPQILFIQNSESISENVREVIKALHFRNVSKGSPSEASTALEGNAFDLAIIYADSGDSVLQKHLRSLRGFNPTIPTIVIAPEYHLKSEQLAFDEGADLYFAEPVPKQTLERMIQHTVRPSEPATTDTERARQQSAHSPERPAQVSALQVLRDFSQILSFSLDYKAFTQHFILKLRDHISFSRIGIFLENDGQKSFASKNHPTTLGCHLAIPTSDRERLIGVAVLEGFSRAQAHCTKASCSSMPAPQKQIGISNSNFLNLNTRPYTK